MCKSVDIFIAKGIHYICIFGGEHKTATAKYLRYKTSWILENIRKGNEVVITFRGKSVAVLMPIEKVKREFNPVGFAIWKERMDFKKPAEWVEEKRREKVC